VRQLNECLSVKRKLSLFISALHEIFRMLELQLKQPLNETRCVNMYVSDITITESASKSLRSTMKSCSPEKEFKGNCTSCCI